MRPAGHAANAVALLRSGGAVKDAEKFWERIARIDPDDTVAAYYIRAASDGSLDGETPDYAYQVPQKEAFERLKYVSDMLSQHCGDLETPWREDKKFRTLLKWCLTVTNPQFRRAAVTALAALEDAEAEATLREVLTRPEISYDMKFNALMLLRMRGVDLSRALPPSIDAQDGLYAVEVLEDEYGLSPASALALIALRARARRRLVPCLRRRIPAYAAALTYCYLSMRGAKPSFRRLCRQFGCAFRTTVFYATRIADAIEEDGNDRAD